MKEQLFRIVIFVLSISFLALAFAYTPDQILQLNSQQLGFNGPLQTNLQYSDQYGISLNNKYTQALGLADAIALELDFGTGQYRLGFTWAHLFSVQQRIKITIERLAQNISFNFASGSTHNWIGQNAIGGEYKYIVNRRWLNSFDISGYISQANSKTLATTTFWQNGILYDNIRHIAGATSENLALGFDSLPWHNGKISFAIDYDNVHFSPLYESAQNRSGLGGSVGIEQLISHKLKLQLLSSFRQPFNQYQAGIFWLPNSYPGTRLELGLNYTHLTNHTSLPDENIYGLQLAYSWGNDKNSPTPNFSITPDQQQSLTDWTNQPAVHMPTVLAMRDQKIQRHVTTNNKQHALTNTAFPSSQTIPDQHLYSDNSKDLTLDIKSLGHFQPDNLNYAITEAGHPPIKDLHLDPNKNGVLVIPKATSGTYSPILIAASNSMGNTMQGFSLTIDQVDDPWADHINDQWITINQNYQFDAHNFFHYSHTAKPDQHNYLKYSLDPSSSIFTITDREAKLTGTIPADATSSPYNISIKADKIIKDHDTGFKVTQSYKLYVEPTVATTTGDYSYKKNAPISINAKNDAKFNSNGSPQLTFSLNTAPSWLTIDPTTGVITAKENSSDYGDYSFQVIGTKTTTTIGAKQAIWKTTVKITPLPTTIPNQWADSNNVNLDISSAFTDPNRKLIYNINSNDSLTINQGRISGKLKNPESTPGHKITVTAKISSGEQQTASFTVYADPALASNNKNILTLPNQQIPTVHSATEGFTNHGNNSWWSYSIDSALPPGLNFNPQNGDISGNAPATTGNYSFKVKATKAPPGVSPKSIEWPVTIKVGSVLNCPHNPPDPEVLHLPYTTTVGGTTFTFTTSKYTAVDTKNFDGRSLETSGNHKALVCKYSHGTEAHLPDIEVKTNPILPADSQEYGNYGVIFFK